MSLLSKSTTLVLSLVLVWLVPTRPASAALLAYEPFTNAPGTAIIGSGDGSGFSGTWQANSSGGVATNTADAPGYADLHGNVLLTAGGAGFFQGLTSANTSMQPFRLFNFSRGTNGADGVTTWISFLVVRQGPLGNLAGNPFGRGANVCHDVNAGTLQKLAVGNSSGAATNTVGLIPRGDSANLKSSTNTFGNFTNFVVVRIDHRSGALDNAWLFVNPSLDAEPSTGAAHAGSLGGFDFSFDRLRVFAGGQNSTAQPYAEMIVDEYRVGETYADVAPHTNSAPPEPAGPLVITNLWSASDRIVLSGTGGSAGGTYYLLAWPDLGVASTNWPAIATNSFDNNGRFSCTSSIAPGSAARFYRLLTGAQPIVGPLPPVIIVQPQPLSVIVSNNATFTVVAGGTAPLSYQWYYNTNTLLALATGASLTITHARFSDAGFYSVVVSNSLGSVSSSNAALAVNPTPIAPSISFPPQSLTVTQGQSASFAVSAGGTEPLIYQWYLNTNTPLPDAANGSCTVTNAQGSNAGAYSVVITNLAGSVTSAPAWLTVLVPPYLAAQPQNQFVAVSNTATFSVTAGGTAPLFYRWYFNTNTLLAFATGASLTITNAQAANAGAYSAVISNNFGSVASGFAILTVSSNGLVPGAYFVAPDGSDSNPGTEASPFKTITNGLRVVGNGGVLYLRRGTYAQAYKMTLSKTANPANRIRLWAYPGETPVIDNAGIGGSVDGISISGHWYHLKGIKQQFATHNGINISGNSNIVETCVVFSNGNTGLHITGGSSGSTYPAYNLVLNCDAFLNYDPPVGGNADGFSAKWNLGPGNVFSGCRAWLNSDDGWDLWMGTSPVVISNCWAFWSGTNYWNNSQFNGNGNGFKLGGNYVGAPHRLVRSAAFANLANGIDQNNNVAGQTVDNCTAWANSSRNFNLNHGANTNAHVVRNNLSIAGGSSDSFTGGTLVTNNSWQLLSPAASPGDVLGVDTTLVTGPRQADGSLPDLPFLRPVPGGRLIDRGVNLGEPFSGAAPELGAFESSP
jgi:hypothetical protein